MMNKIETMERLTIGGRLLGPDEYTLNRKTGTVTVHLPVEKGSVVVTDYRASTKAPRKEAQWKRDLRGRRG